MEVKIRENTIKTREIQRKYDQDMKHSEVTETATLEKKKDPYLKMT